MSDKNGIDTIYSTVFILTNFILIIINIRPENTLLIAGNINVIKSYSICGYLHQNVQ